MAFADPQSITINSVATSLPRTGSTINSGTFQKDDGTVKMTVSHALNKRARRTIRVDHTKVVPDPLFPSQNKPVSMSVYIVVDTPPVGGGYSNADIKYVVDALTGYLSASSGAKVTQLLGGES